MADIAQLGIAVDSSQVRKGADDLRNFEAVARRTGETAEQVRDRFAKMNSEVGKAAAPANSAAKGQAQYSDATNKVIQSLALQEQRLSMTGKQWSVFQNLNKAGVSATSEAGQKIAQATEAIYDMEQAQKKLSAANDNSNSSVSRFASRFSRGLITAAAITSVQQLIKYLIDLNAQLAQTADTAQRVGVGGQLFQGLQAAAGNKGIGNGDFNAAMISFNQQVGLAKSGLGDLRVLLSSNGQVVSNTAETLSRVADLVQRATGDYNRQVSILQQAGLPATQQWVQLFEQGGAAINKIAQASTKLSDQQLEEAKKLNDKWNELWTNFETWGKRAIVNIVGATAEISSAIKNSLNQQGGGFSDQYYGGGFDPSTGMPLAGGSAAAAPKSALGRTSPLPANPTPAVTRGPDLSATKGPAPFDPNLAKQQIALEQQRIGLLGPLATVEDQVRAKQLEINQAALNNVSISKSQRDALLLITQAQAEQTRVNQQAQIGVFDYAKAQQAANDSLKALVAQKLLDPNNAQQWAAAMNNSAKAVENLANNAKVAGAPLEGLQRLANEAGSVRTQVDQFATTSLNGLSDGLVSIANNSASAGDAFKNFGMTVVTALEKMAIQLTIIKPLADALQSSLGGGLGFLGLGGGAGSGAFSAQDSALNSSLFPGYGTGFAAANGGTFGPGWGVVGERGPELIKVHTGGGVTVIPNHISKPYLPGFADGGMLSANGGVSRLPFGQDNSPRVTVNLIEDANRAGQVHQSTSSDGGLNIEAYVDSITAKNAANPGSATSQVLNQRGRLASR